MQSLLLKFEHFSNLHRPGVSVTCRSTCQISSELVKSLVRYCILGAIFADCSNLWSRSVWLHRPYFVNNNKESLYLKCNTLPHVRLFNYQVLNLVHKMVFSPHLLPSISRMILHPLTLFIDMKLDTMNKLYLTHVNTKFGQQIPRYKKRKLLNYLPNNLSNNTASQSFRNKL